MRHATYKGPLRALRGCGALVRPARGIGSNWLLAQFDRVKAPEAESMCYGWHTLPRRHFRATPARSHSHWRKLNREQCARGRHAYSVNYFCVVCGISEMEAVERGPRKAGMRPELCAPFEPGTQIEVGADLYYLAAGGLMVVDTRGPVRLLSEPHYTDRDPYAAQADE